MNIKVMAYIHSLEDKQTMTHNLDECEIIEHIDNNNVVAKYKGVKCTAIYNVFTGTYFVDDVYGKFEDTESLCE